MNGSTVGIQSLDIGAFSNAGLGTGPVPTVDARTMFPDNGETAETELVEKKLGSALEQEDFSDYNAVALPKLTTLEGDWKAEILATETRRKIRNIDINVRELRRANKIPKDETIIPIRLIDTNINREMPTYISYLKQSRRISIFKDVDDPSRNTETLEAEFTRVCQYDGWELPHYKILDGSRTHGWCFGEVVFDADKPGQVAVEDVEHANLMFPLDALNIQSCEYVTRIYYVTDAQLRGFVKNYGFDPEQTMQLLQKSRQAQTSRCSKIRKCMWKNADDGLVYVAWYCLEDCSDWLKKPEPLFLGVKRQEQVIEQVPTGMLDPVTQQPVTAPQPKLVWKDVYETSYPYEVLYYYETESPKIFDHKGRVWLDQYKQEAAMATWTAYINTLNRSSNVYGSPKQTGQAPTDGKPKLQNIDLVHGGLYDTPIDFWAMPGPSPQVLTALNALDTQNANETGQVAFTVQNREDSRKTATEVAAAQQQNSLINGVQVTLYSVFLRRLYTRIWRIVRSRAQLGIEQGGIKFLNNVQLEMKQFILSQEYQIFAAGDVDVIQRQEKLQRKMQFWPIIAATPMAQPFFVSMIKDGFPDEAPALIAEMMAAQQQQQVIAGLGTALAGLAKEFGNQIPQAQQAQILQLLDAAGKSAGQGQQQANQQQPTSAAAGQSASGAR
jgi:hypothetical protein